MYISLHTFVNSSKKMILEIPAPPTPTLASRAVLLIYTPLRERNCFFPPFPTFVNSATCHSDRPRMTGRGFCLKCCWHVVPSFPRLLISAGVLLKGDRRRRRSPKSSGMLWPMRKPGSWQRSGRWRWRTVLAAKVWRSASMRSSRWASAWVSVWGHLLQPPGWSLVGPVLGQCVLYENRNQTCLSRKEFDIPSWLIHFTLYRWGNWGSDREEIVCSGDWFEDRARNSALCIPNQGSWNGAWRELNLWSDPAWDPAPTLLLTAVWPWEACWTSLSFLFVIFVLITLSLRFLEDSRRWKM